MAERFRNRVHAGQALAASVAEYGGQDDVVVLGLPRGGVPVAAEVAKALGAPLDIVVVRKVGFPSQPEVAMGAIASIAGTVVTVRNPDVVAHLGRDADRSFRAVEEREREELQRREALYREGRAPLALAGKTVMLVDDGLATGATMRAAVGALEPSGAARTIIAVPIGAADTCEELARLVDEVVCLWIPQPFWAVGQGYLDFSQTSDDEVRRLLAENSPPG